jgi:hypothetical protein
MSAVDLHQVVSSGLENSGSQIEIFSLSRGERWKTCLREERSSRLPPFEHEFDRSRGVGITDLRHMTCLRESCWISRSERLPPLGRALGELAGEFDCLRLLLSN